MEKGTTIGKGEDEGTMIGGSRSELLSPQEATAAMEPISSILSPPPLQKRRFSSLSLKPEQLYGLTRFFEIDMAFASVASSHICCVDLLAGVLVCDMLSPQAGPRFCFIPLSAGLELQVPRFQLPGKIEFRNSVPWAVSVVHQVHRHCRVL
ncbi:hypothetical protein PR202_gb14987 [Eleusine coracana subsp. coracana]|uniref:DUF1618 domain-containing protein n=1 Tax=Eleusine coracana subsp. coracana TaxID=191504 RepID=A0AAV5EWL2_ELECO|nr:hypothetical protein PR202_gb14987 [Eleusine coracana subsp. coracana]